MAQPRLFATIVEPVAPLPMVPPSPHREAAPAKSIKKNSDWWMKQAQPRTLSAADGTWASRSWSSAERAEMDKFLGELARRPPTGYELSQRALAMARQMGRQTQDEGGYETSGKPKANGKVVDPFSMEMYFDAFVRKLNRSAAFVKDDPGARGSRKALVQISLNSDGSLNSYRVIRSADQEAEIAYIKRVVDRASPFSAFPPDIRNVTDSLSVLMCIFPAHDGQGGGFSRSFGRQDCKD